MKSALIFSFAVTYLCQQLDHFGQSACILEIAHHNYVHSLMERMYRVLLYSEVQVFLHLMKIVEHLSRLFYI